MTNLVLALLRTERPLPLREIGAVVAGYPAEHGALRQAFERDKRALRDGGIPVSVERVDGEDQVGYRIRPEEYYLPDLDLSEEEAGALAFALAAVRLEGRASGELAQKLGAPALDALPPIAELPSLPALGPLELGLRERSRIAFGYHGRARDVAAYGLVFKSGSWYLVGSDAAAGDELRTFRVDRFESEPELGAPGAYEVPADFSAAEALRWTPFEAPGTADLLEVVLAVAPRSAPALLDAFGEEHVESSGPDGTLRLRFSVADERALIGFLLGYGEDVVVEGPAALRAEMIAALEAAAGRAR